MPSQQHHDGHGATPPALPDVHAEEGSAGKLDDPGLEGLFSKSVSLPVDPASVEFRQAIQSLRQNFGNRQAYNSMICDQLAMRGLPPNGSNVLDIGSWGTKSSVISDVRSWYANLASRLSSQHAAIPEGTRRQANQLIEQLWNIAVQTAIAPYRALQDDMVSLRAELDTQNHQAHELSLRHEAQLLQMQSVIDEKNSELQSARAALERIQIAIFERDQRVSELENSIATAALAHRDALLEQGSAHVAEVRRLQEAAALERAAIVAERDRLHDELQRQREAFEARLATKDDQSRGDAKAHAMALDRARQDVREANARADAKMTEAVQLREATFALREEISQLQIENARIQMELARVKAEKKELGDH